MSCSLIPSEAWMWNYCAEYGNAQRPRRVFGCVIPGHCTSLHPRAQTDRIYRSTCDAAAQRCCVKTKPGAGLCIPPNSPPSLSFCHVYPFHLELCSCPRFQTFPGPQMHILCTNVSMRIFPIPFFQEKHRALLRRIYGRCIQWGVRS